MRKIYSEAEIIEGNRKFNEVGDSIDYENLNFNTMTFNKFKELVTKGIYVEELAEVISEFVDRCERDGKTVLETIDEFGKMDFKTKVEEKNKQEEKPLTYDSFRDIMQTIENESLRNMIVNHIDSNRKINISLEQTFKEVDTITKRIKNIEIGKQCCKCDENIKKAFIEYKSEKTYCKKCAEGKIIMLTCDE